MKLVFGCGTAVVFLLASVFLQSEVAIAKEQLPDATHQLGEEMPNVAFGLAWKQLQAALMEAQNRGGDNSAFQLRRIGLELRWRIAEQGGIPLWDGTQLRDVANSLCGAIKLDEEERRMLAKLNYWEQAFGWSSIPPEFRGRMVSLGEERAAIEWYTHQLEERGIHVILDVDAGLWKVEDETEK